MDADPGRASTTWSTATTTSGCSGSPVPTWHWPSGATAPTSPPGPASHVGRWVNDVLVDNHLFGAACKVATRVPAVGRAIVAGASGKGRHEWVDRSDRVFATPRLVRVVEMEYSIPREAFPEAFERLRRLVDRLGAPITVPVEIRWTAGDDIPLSHASGRDSAYIAVHMYRGVPYDQYFQGVETIMSGLRGSAPLGQAPLPERRDAGAALPPMGRVPGRAGGAWTPTAASATRTPTGCWACPQE